MPGVNLIVGNDGSNTLTGTVGDDLIYGFDPNGPQATVTSISGTRVASGLTQPLFAASPPGDTGRLFIVEKTGQIKILDLNSGQILSTPFLDVTSQISAAGEGGLLGLAFDPGFAQNGYIYVNLINTSGDTEIRRYQVSASNPNIIDPASATLIITIDQPGATNHKAGWLGFGPDGYLYAALGDGGGGGDTFHNGQNMDSLLGKMLRLDVHSDAFPGDPTRNYAIPADNPFVGVAGADEIWALGLRNPWRPSFDRATGDFYIADVGQNTWEEIDIGIKGANYGWNTYEGPAAFAGGDPLTGGTLTFPVYSYNHSVGHSITGGYVYRGPSEGLQGQYFFADFQDDKVFTLRFNGTSWVATERTSQISYDAGTLTNPSSFGQDALGNLYVVDFDGEVFRLTPNVASADQGDTINGMGGNDLIFGGAGNDMATGGDGNDEIQGGAGNDTINGNNGLDLLSGGSGNDTIAGGAGADALVGEAGSDGLDGGAAADRLNGGAGLDALFGGPGADRFVFDAAALADARLSVPVFDTIFDYDRGNSGAFSAAEGDQIDLSALLSTAYNGGSGQPVASLVRLIANGSGGADLQIDTDGNTNGANWVTIARLDQLPLGSSVNVILDSAAPGGVSIVFGSPDLQVTGISAPLSAVLGASFAFSYMIRNAGTAAAGLHFSGINVDQQVDENHWLAWNQINSLGVNANATISNSISTSGLSVGTHTLYIKEDYWANMIGESDETNNVRSITFDVTAPDLQVTSISAPLSVVQGASFDFSYMIRNAGNAGAGLHFSGINVDQQVDENHWLAWNQVNSLGASATATLSNSISTGGLSLGPHTLYIKEDYWANMIGESDETNNVRSITFNVTAPAGQAAPSGSNLSVAGLPASAPVSASADFNWDTGTHFGRDGHAEVISLSHLASVTASHLLLV
jgi:glucose/arabinose dehydrogenase